MSYLNYEKKLFNEIFNYMKNYKDNNLHYKIVKDLLNLYQYSFQKNDLLEVYMLKTLNLMIDYRINLGEGVYISFYIYPELNYGQSRGFTLLYNKNNIYKISSEAETQLNYYFKLNQKSNSLVPNKSIENQLDSFEPLIKKLHEEFYKVKSKLKFDYVDKNSTYKNSSTDLADINTLQIKYFFILNQETYFLSREIVNIFDFSKIESYSNSNEINKSLKKIDKVYDDDYILNETMKKAEDYRLLKYMNCNREIIKKSLRIGLF